MPGYDVPAIAEKTGKSEAHIYAHLKLLDLIEPVAQAFLEERITGTHALLIARLPQARQAEAFEHCWRKDWQDKEAHLLPARFLAAWIEQNVYRHLAEAPFPVEDADLVPQAGACSDCERRSCLNTRP